MALAGLGHEAHCASRTSGESLLFLPMAPILPILGAFRKPGAIHKLSGGMVEPSRKSREFFESQKAAPDLRHPS